MPGTMYSLAEYTQMGYSGKVEDVNELMRILTVNNNFIHQKMIDYALSLVGCGEGREQIKHYLFHGSPIQRNYAALYFKRLGHQDVLEEAVRLNCIDAIQAFSR